MATKLDKKVTSPLKPKFRTDKNMTSTVKKVDTINSELYNSVIRGNILRYSLYIDGVKENLNSLKNSNPKYLSLIDKIIQISITELPVYDIDVPLDKLLSNFNYVSYYNHEVLDFTQEVLNNADILTSKLYLTSIAENIISNEKLKKHFEAATPFVKNILAYTQKNEDLEKSAQFINAIKIIINEKADYRKIALLPKIKYTVDSISRKNHNIDVTKIIYSKTSAKKISERLETIVKDGKAVEKNGQKFDCTDYLITNSL